MGKSPEFDEEEAYLLDFVANGRREGQWFDTSYLVVGVGLTIWGLAEQNLIAGGLGVIVIVVGFFQRQKADRHWTDVTRRILLKYGEACKPEEDDKK